MSTVEMEKGVARPTLAFALGDAAGIGSELAAKALCDSEIRDAARFVVLGDRRQLEQGAREAGLTDRPELSLKTPSEAGPEDDMFVDLGNLDPATVTPGEGSEITGGAALGNFAAGLRLAAAGAAEAVTFTPFNKHSMRLARPEYVDEIGFIQHVAETDADGSEFNVLDEFWNARVTSHVPLSAVAGMITQERVLRAILRTDATMRGAGMDRPRIAVAALNPHAGDGGNFGPEDAEVIAPAVEAAKARQLSVTGPIPSDTVYLRAHKGEFDAVLSMYHDQGQIAMKLIGFDRGVTLIGGFDFWIATPAHGSAYDIAGQGVANPNATKRALLLAAHLAGQSQRPRATHADRLEAIARLQAG